MPVLLKNDKTFKKAHKEYKHFTADDAMMNAIEAREKWERDQNSRLYTARKKGREEAIILVAKSMISDGMANERISRLTGLSIDEIEKIRSSI